MEGVSKNLTSTGWFLHQKMKINRKSAKKIIEFQIIYVLFMNMFISWLHFPQILTYFTDLINIPLFIFYVLFNPTPLKKSKAEVVIVSMLLLFVSIIGGLVFNMVNPLLVIWGARNVFRGFFFFLACIAYLEYDDIVKLLNLMVTLQIPNTVIVLIQFWQGYQGDYLGGIFGVAQGCNGYLNIYLSIIMTYMTVEYVYKKQPFYKLAFVAGSSMLIAALTELKIYYAEFILIIILAVLLGKVTYKHIFIIVVSIASFVIGLNVMEKLFPLQFSFMMNFDKIMEYATMQGGGYNISRLGAFKQISELFFENDLIKKLFGLGFGSCEMSSFDFLTSTFYKMNWRYNYRWFAHMMFFLETGYVGFSLFVGFFLSVFLYVCINRKKYKSNQDVLILGIFTQVFTMLMILNLWYNQAIRTEAQYLIYFSLAGFFVLIKGINNNQKQDKMSEM